MTSPSLLLLLWCGCAATFAAAITGILIGGARVGNASLAPRPTSRWQALLWSITAGLVAYPLACGLAFELIGAAHVHIGLVAGALIGAPAALAARTLGSRNAIRVFVAHAVYGAVLGFLYITP